MQDAEYPVRFAEVRAACDEGLLSGTPVVYFVQAGDDGPIKIGFCSKLEGVPKRIGSLQVGCPWPLVVRRVMKADYGRNAEARLHSHFAAHRLMGEWFSPALEVIEMATGFSRSTLSAIERAAATGYATGYAAGRDVEYLEMTARIAKEMRKLADGFDEGNVLAEREAAVLTFHRQAAA